MNVVFDQLCQYDPDDVHTVEHEGKLERDAAGGCQRAFRRHDESRRRRILIGRISRIGTPWLHQPLLRDCTSLAFMLPRLGLLLRRSGLE